MRDAQLDSKLRLLSLQLDNWRKLHELVTSALDKAKPIISAEQERQFTEIRANLLQESEHVLSQLNLVHELSPRVMGVLARASSMRVVRDLSGNEARRLETEWNFVFTKLGLAQGQLKSRRKALAGQNIFSYWLATLLRRPLTT
jgi:hypothetical protein